MHLAQVVASVPADVGEIPSPAEYAVRWLGQLGQLHEDELFAIIGGRLIRISNCRSWTWI